MTDDHPPAGGTPHGDDEDLDPRAVDDAAHRIARDLPSVPLATVHAALREHLAATRLAKVRNFRLLLAERNTRQQLARHANADIE